ncbi:MFS multidrug transporter-like protein [Geopyxis carbonaria]|nr:MFS multidrug transporter-like protein [Geopyxis carbonaria]
MGDDTSTTSSKTEATQDLEKAALPTTTVPSIAPPPPPLATWTLPHDPRNPKTWPLAVRLFHTAHPSLFSLATTISVSIYTPAIPALTDALSTTPTLALLGLSVFSLGLGLGPVLAAPLSETYGRRPIYLLSAPLSLLFHIGAALSPSLPSLLVCRFLAALFGAPPLALGGGTLADLWDMRTHGAIVAGGFTLTPFLGPVLGPLLGGFIPTSGAHWRWHAGGAPALLLAPLVVASVFTRETYAPAILAHPRPPLTARRLVQTLARPIAMLGTEPILAALAVYAAFAMGLMFAFFATYPLVFNSIYNFRSHETGLAFLGIAAGLLAAYATFIYLHSTPHRSPEGLLRLPTLAALPLPASLLLFAFTARASTHWILPVLAGVPFGWATLGLFLGIACYLVEAYGPAHGASALAATGLLRYGFGAAMPLAVGPMVRVMGVAGAGSVWAAVALLLAPVPWVLVRWGAEVRGRSGRAVKMGMEGR